MLEFLSIGSHSSKCCPAVKELLQARVALAWGRPTWFMYAQLYEKMAVKLPRMILAQKR